MQKKYLGFLVGLFVLLAAGFVGAVPQIEVESFSYDPAPVIPGSTVSIWLQIKNNSSEDFTNGFVRLQLDDPQTGRGNFPFNTPATELTKTVSILPFQTITVRFATGVSPQALSGNYTVAVNMGKGDKSFLEVKETIDVVARKPKIEIIDAPITQYKPGSQFEFPLRIKNLGSAKAINVLIGVDEDRTVTSTGTVVDRPINSIGNSLHFVDSIDPLEEKVVSLSLAIDNTANVQTYTVPVTIQWQDENRTDYTETRIVGIRVIKLPDIDVSLGEIKPSETQTGAREVSVDIFNKGSSTAKNVIVNVEAIDGQLLSSNKIFIGTLESDDFDSFKNTVIMDGNMGGSFKLTVTFSNANDEALVVEKTVTVPANTGNEKGSSGGIDFIGLLIPLIIGGIIGWLVRPHLTKKRE